jgi:hypothetical protein
MSKAAGGQRSEIDENPGRCPGQVSIGMAPATGRCSRKLLPRTVWNRSQVTGTGPGAEWQKTSGANGWADEWRSGGLAWLTGSQNQ